MWCRISWTSTSQATKLLQGLSPFSRWKQKETEDFNDNIPIFHIITSTAESCGRAIFIDTGQQTLSRTVDVNFEICIICTESRVTWLKSITSQEAPPAETLQFPTKSVNLLIQRNILFIESSGEETGGSPFRFTSIPFLNLVISPQNITRRNRWGRELCGGEETCSKKGEL